MDITKTIESVKTIFEHQKKGYSPSNIPSYEIRMDRLSRIEALCRNHIPEITKALQADFGSRSADWCFMADIYSPLSQAQYVKRHLKKWMKKERVSSGLLGTLTGQRSYIVNEPLGVVGIISPFNAPVSLAFDPAIEAIAAGNRVMIKIAESTPQTADILKVLTEEYFTPEELSIVSGGLEISKLFASLPWDKLFFTGGAEVGKKILAAAAEHLTPVILELGGKSPCVVLEDANIVETAEKIAKVRQLNAGQVCISGDYVLLPEKHLKAFIERALEVSEAVYPDIVNNQEFTSIIDANAYNRIIGYIQEAEASGCRVIQANPKNESVPDLETRKIPLTLVINPAENLRVSQNEIFGPILSIYTYQKLEAAIAYINAKEKPLALYIFGKNRKHIDAVIHNTSSGGITINDLLLHAGSHSMGFGGVGYSGMGRYKGGMTGYKSFTNPKAVVEQGIMRKITGNFLPPFTSDRPRNTLRKQVGLK